MARDQEVLVSLPAALVESHPAVLAGAEHLDFAMTAAIVETVERDRDAFERPTARAGTSGHLVAALDPPGEEHQVGQQEVLRHQVIVVVGEVLAHRGHHKIGARLGETRHNVGGV